MPDFRADTVAFRVIAVVLFAAMVWGWWEFYFLTDDAYIAFRYVSNSVTGVGLTWNQPPFAPVEGYTSFLWVVILEVVWRVFGVDPPHSANYISLGFGIGTLAVALRICQTMWVPDQLRHRRTLVFALVGIGIVSNRTFLTWLSSGLETSLFNFCVTWWVFEALRLNPKADGFVRTLRLCIAASAIALTRPDGLLFVLATAVLLVLPALIELRCLFNREGGRRIDVFRRWFSWRNATAALPLVAPAIHVLWRHSYYGAWLPNTYYAKVTEAWPEAGIRHFVSFVLEYGIWAWFLLAGASAVGLASKPRLSWRNVVANCHVIVVIGVIVAHLGYYVLIVGGDHFEYRVFSYLVPLLWVSAASMTLRLLPTPMGLVAGLLVLMILSLPVQWVHYSRTRDLNTRHATHKMIVPIADAFPIALRPTIEQWDDWQRWLIKRHVGMRHQEHKIFHLYSLARFPDREHGSDITWDDRPVLAAGSVGVAGWMLPGVAVIDTFGLNDRVIARSEPARKSGALRKMAHDRRPPAGYEDCFKPNVITNKVSRSLCLTCGPATPYEKRTVRAKPRARPLTDADIIECERHYSSEVGLEE